MRRLLLLIAIVIGVGAATPRLHAEEATEPCRFVDGTAQVLAGTFQVITASGSGTAFYIGEGEFLTAAHVVGGGGHLQLRTRARQFDATLVGLDGPSDLALLQADGSGLTPLPLGDFDRLRPGQTLGAAGFPGAAEDFASRPGRPSVSAGVLSKVVERDGVTYIQTSAEVNPGNSGGPLFTECGEIVGVVSAKYDAFGGRPVEGISYAVALPTIYQMIPQLRTGESADASPAPDSLPIAAMTIAAFCNAYWTGSNWDGMGQTRETCHTAGQTGLRQGANWSFFIWADAFDFSQVVLSFDGQRGVWWDDSDPAFNALAPGWHTVQITAWHNGAWLPWSDPYHFRIGASATNTVEVTGVCTFWSGITSWGGCQPGETTVWLSLGSLWLSHSAGKGPSVNDRIAVRFDGWYVQFFYPAMRMTNSGEIEQPSWQRDYGTRGQHTVEVAIWENGAWSSWSPPFTFTIR